MFESIYIVFIHYWSKTFFHLLQGQIFYKYIFILICKLSKLYILLSKIHQQGWKFWTLLYTFIRCIKKRCQAWNHSTNQLIASEAKRSELAREPLCTGTGKQNNCITRKRSILGIWFIEEKSLFSPPKPISVMNRPDPARPDHDAFTTLISMNYHR